MVALNRKIAMVGTRKTMRDNKLNYEFGLLSSPQFPDIYIYKFVSATKRLRNFLAVYKQINDGRVYRFHQLAFLLIIGVTTSE